MTADHNPRTLGGLLNEAVDARLSELHTAMPGRVEAYDLAAQTVDVTPLLKRVVLDLDGNELVEELPIIYAVPVAFPRAGKAFVSFPLAKDDIVLLVFCERSIDQWQEKGGVQDPGDLGMHGLGYAVAYPGVYDGTRKLANAHADHIVIGWDNGKRIYIKSDGVDIGALAGAEAQCLATTLKTYLDQMNTFVSVIDTTLKTWPVAPADGGLALKTAYVAAQPGAAPAVSAFESTKHKIDE